MSVYSYFIKKFETANPMLSQKDKAVINSYEEDELISFIDFCSSFKNEIKFLNEVKTLGILFTIKYKNSTLWDIFQNSTSTVQAKDEEEDLGKYFVRYEKKYRPLYCKEVFANAIKKYGLEKLNKISDEITLEYLKGLGEGTKGYNMVLDYYFSNKDAKVNSFITNPYRQLLLVDFLELPSLEDWMEKRGDFLSFVEQEKEKEKEGKVIEKDNRWEKLKVKLLG